MLEYIVIADEFETHESLTNLLNVYARDGWHVVCHSHVGLVLEREKQPTVEESEKKTTIIYNWL